MYRFNFFFISVIVFFLALLPLCILLADPWGKDADLAAICAGQASLDSPCSTPVLGPLGEMLIRFHQEVISPADGPRSHHKPSSSQYTLDAMRKYGFFYGVLLGCDRLMRENSDAWIYPVVNDSAGDTFKWDPVK
ncbi:MAG: membrane protein insertion efficiency factor YidD [Waddliaceae bacterium]